MVNDLIVSDEFLELVDTKLDLPHNKVPVLNEYHNYESKVIVNRSRNDDYE